MEYDYQNLNELAKNVAIYIVLSEIYDVAGYKTCLLTKMFFV